MNKLEWEEIADEGLANYKTHRMRVDGGCIYRYIHDDEAHVLFVPDSQSNVSQDQFIEEKARLLNKIGDLSMRVNLFQSGLREFEKQKVEPLVTRLDHQTKWLGELRQQYIDNHQRIEKLESRQDPLRYGMGAPVPCANTLQLCEHGIPVKIPCPECKTSFTGYYP